MLLRIEDLALGDPRPTLRRLQRFVGIRAGDGDEDVEAAAAACEGHERSYGGHKWPKALRQRALHEWFTLPQGRFGIEALDFFGYDPLQWGVRRADPASAANSTSQRLTTTTALAD